MPKLQVPQSVQPRQIDFDSSVVRSKPGALYFAPGTVKSITKSEWDYMQIHHKQFVRKLVVLSMDEPKAKPKDEKPQEKVPVGPKNNPSQAALKAKRISEGKLGENKTQENLTKNAPTQNVPTAPVVSEPVQSTDKKTADESGKGGKNK